MRVAAALGALLLAACAEDRSAMAPQGPDAARIATLAWWLFGGGAVVLGLAMAALWLALRGSEGMRARLADRRAVLAGGIALPVVLLSAALTYGLWLMQSPAPASDLLRIKVTGEQWWWRVVYEVDGVAVPTANEIRIPVGRPVEFILASADVLHSFWVPSLGGKMDMIPGRTTKLRLSADRPGAFRGFCAEYCGGAHALMGFKVIAHPAGEFDAWLAALALPAGAPVGEIAQRGQALFLSAGCGSCHAVRGTQAAGRVGPDLTHLGSRLAVGTDTRPMTEENLARFVTDPEHVKPGTTMPPFRIFSAEDLAALTAYLQGLR